MYRWYIWVEIATDFIGWANFTSSWSWLKSYMLATKNLNSENWICALTFKLAAIAMIANINFFFILPFFEGYKSFSLNAKDVRLYTCSSLILGRRKPMVNDEQIESHAKSYTYPQKCAAEVCPPWHTTRVDYTTYPWHLLCNVIDNHFEFPTFRTINEQSVDDALCMFANALIANALQGYKKSVRIYTSMQSFFSVCSNSMTKVEK